ncbi:MAG: AraC family transcriptional regulator [Lachnospiraceae bacterium]|mgnify:CR=1 FL=1|nr:AraC family transcriptional regulator [Lachnospiraceae bacterium]
MNTLLYEDYHETKSHTGSHFAYNTYLCTIPLDFSHVPLHWHDETEIIYIKRGEGIITVDLQEYHVHAGSVILVCPGQLHSIAQYEDTRMEYENIIFHMDILLSKNPDICSTDFLLPLSDGRVSLCTHLTPDLPHYREVADCLDRADEICTTMPNGYQLFLKSQLLQMFYLLFTHFTQKRVSHKDYASFDKIKFILKYVEQHYAEKITIEQIADETGFSSSHFMKFFKQTMGISFTSYLNEYRLTMASRRLLTSDTPVITIASEIGIDNVSYFNRIFKRRFGVTPSVYRKQYGSVS